MKRSPLAILGLMAATVGIGSSAATMVMRPDPIPAPSGKSGGGKPDDTPRHTRAHAWKRAFKGMAVPHIKTTQFFFD